MKTFYYGIFSAMLFLSFVEGNSQTLYTPTSVTDAMIPGAQQWFTPGCCDLSHTRDNSAMSGAGLAAIHEACDDAAYFNEFGISNAYSTAQGQNPATVLPGYNINFSPGQTMNGIVVWNTCFVQPMQGHYQHDANIRGFNMVITHGAGTANVNGQTFNNTLTDCAAQVKLFGATYNNVTQVRVVPTSAHANFSNPTAGGDRNMYVSEVRGILQIVLDVELENFTAEAKTENIEISWNIKTEKNCNNYLVDRSLDGGKTWEFLNRIPSIGDGADHFYSISDFNPVPGMMAYRLTQVDQNGAQNELRSATAFFNGKDFVAIFPVPVLDKLNIKQIRFGNAPVNVKIFDLQGNLVWEENGEDLSKADLVIDMSNFGKGRYFVICSDFNGNLVKKAIVKE